MLRRVDWPNHQGFTFVDDIGNDVLDVHDKAGDHRLNLQSLEPDGSMCGFSGVKHFSLDRNCELGLNLIPEHLSGEALLALVNEHGENCG